jgi:hypothetical protein
MAEWVIISNPKLYNLEGAFNEFIEIDYKQSTNICTNDVIFIYVAAPYKEIKYKCVAIEVNKPNRNIDTSKYDIDNEKYRDVGRYMRLSLVEKYDGVLLFQDLIRNGLKAVQGPSKVTLELSNYIAKTLEMARNR